MKAHALREIMLTHDKIFVMGHKNPDADCVGAALGIYRLSKTLGKSTYIVMDSSLPILIRRTSSRIENLDSISSSSFSSSNTKRKGKSESACTA